MTMLNAKSKLFKWSSSLSRPVKTKRFVRLSLSSWSGEQSTTSPNQGLVRAALTVLAVGLAVLLADTPQLEANDGLDQVTVKSHSRIPGARTTYEVSFVTSETLDGVTDSIEMELDPSIRVPTSIRASSMTLTHSGAGARVHGNPHKVSLSKRTDPDQPTTISIAPGVKVNSSTVDIPAGSTVTVIFTAVAALSNPTRGGAYSWLVSTSRQPEPVAAVHPESKVRQDFAQVQGHAAAEGLLVERVISLSKRKTVRGERVAVTARGFREGLSLWVWRDSNADGLQDNDEGQLCQTTVSTLGIGQCNFEVRVPPFTPASGGCLSSSGGCNLINAHDGAHHGLNLSGKTSAYLSSSTQMLELAGKIEVAPTVGAIRELDVMLSDFPAGTIQSVTVGGSAADVGSLTVGTSGRLSFTLSVPAGVRAGQHLLELALLRDDTGNRYLSSVVVDVNVVKTEVGVSPDTVLPNQTLAIWGKGFSTKEGAVIREVQVGGHQLEPALINYGAGFIPVDSDGSWAGSVRLPIISATMEQGTYSLHLVDTHGESGSIEYVVGPREVAVTPARSRPGSIIEVSGTGFPAFNHAGSRINLLIRYESAAGETNVSAQADHEGNFHQELAVPLDTPSPSSNAVRVEFYSDDGEVIASTIEHEVSEPEVWVSPASGPPGTTVSLAGSGFRHYAPVTSVSVGGIDVLGGQRLSTDALGRLSLHFIIPGTGIGPQPIRVDVSGSLARSFFQVSPGVAVSGNALTVSEALAGLGDRLNTVFYFDNLSKSWSFYDPVLDEGNTLQYMTDGGVYFIRVFETVEAILNGEKRTLTCINGNCWNVITW